jgi:IclR family transcriptional regulator, KDG regulon repressor
VTGTATKTQKTKAENGARPTNRYAIAVLGKALDLLDALDTGETLTLTELSARVGVPKATALRVLANLEERDYVERDAHSQYRLGMRLLQLGARKASGLDLRTMARPVMKSLHAEFDETVNLAVPGDDGIIYIDILQSPRGLRMAATVGMRDPYHSSALGKAMLAHGPESRVEQIVGGPLGQKTERTVATIERLKDELAEVRRRGYAIDDEENEAGARCIGAPILDHRGQCAGAISVSGSASRLTDERIAALAERVRAAAAAISRTMGYQTRD